MIVHLSIGVKWNPSCTKNTPTKPLCLPLWNKHNDSMLCLVVYAIGRRQVVGIRSR
jgi:hypothetical protein